VSLTDLIVSQTDPVTAVLLLGVLWHTRSIRSEMRREISQTRDRIERLESDAIDDS